MTTRRAEAYWIEAEKRWKISVSREGIRKCFADPTKGKTGKHLCEAKADRWLRTFETSQQFGEAVEMFLKDKAKTISAAAYKSLDIQFRKHLLPAFPPSRQLARISPYDWQRVIDAFAEEGHTQSYTNVFVSYIKNFLSYCESRMWEIAPVKPGQLIATATKQKHEKKSLESEQIKALLSLSPDDFDHITTQQYVNLFRLSLVSGLRRGELLGLKWSDVSDSTITISRAVSPVGEITQGKTSNSRRTIPQTQMTRDILASQLNFQQKFGGSDWIFGDWLNGWEHTTAPFHVTTAWKNVSNRLGLSDISVHELRHTFISLFKADMPLALLKQTVGHSAAMDTIGVYGHQTQADVEISGEIIDSLFQKLQA